MSYKAAVVIPYHKNRQPLLASLRSLAEQDIPADDFEVIVVDDGRSDPDLANIIEDFERLNVRLSSYLSHRGAAFARNFGWQQADAEIIVFLDGDQILKPQFLRHHLALFDHVPESLDVLQMGLRNDIPHAGIKPTSAHDYVLSEDARFAVFELYSENMQMLQGGWHLCFSHNLSVRKAVLERLGGFDEDIFSGWGLEDSEFAYKLTQGGVKIVYNPRILTYHIRHPLNWNSPEGYLQWRSNLGSFIAKHPHHIVSLQRIFSDFFDPEVRASRIEQGDQRPWLTCYQKFEDCARTIREVDPALPGRTFKNPSLETLIDYHHALPHHRSTAIVSASDTATIVGVQTHSATRNVSLYTY